MRSGQAGAERASAAAWYSQVQRGHVFLCALRLGASSDPRSSFVGARECTSGQQRDLLRSGCAKAASAPSGNRAVRPRPHEQGIWGPSGPAPGGRAPSGAA